MIRVVVADDAPFIREIVKQTVERAGMQLVAEAENGEEAVAHVRRFHPHVVLLDLVMPKLNGIDAARQILEVQPHTKVVAFSTLDQKDIVEKALASGCCDFLEKPFSAEDLVRVIRNAIRTYE